MSDIPERERWLYENPEALERVRKGLEQSKRGEAEYLGDFSKYVEEEE